jgi:hypothetical protein
MTDHANHCRIENPERVFESTRLIHGPSPLPLRLTRLCFRCPELSVFHGAFVREWPKLRIPRTQGDFTAFAKGIEGKKEFTRITMNLVPLAARNLKPLKRMKAIAGTAHSTETL